MKLALMPGTTSKIVHIFIQDSSSTVGAGLTGLVYNSASLVAHYIRPGDASPTAITLATATIGTWASGGFKEVSAANMPGVYEFGIPNACLASGAKQCVIMLKGATNMAPCLLEIQLDLQPTVWDEVLTGSTHNITNSAGRLLRQINGVIQAMQNDWVDSGTAQAGAASTITLRSGAPSVDLTGNIVLIDSGTGADQVRLITAYNTGTKVATVNRNWGTNPDNTSTYIVLPNVPVSTNTYNKTAEVTSVPAATSSLDERIAWLFALARNKITQTSTTATLRNDADSGNLGTATVSDDGTTFTRGEWA